MALSLHCTKLGHPDVLIAVDIATYELVSDFAWIIKKRHSGFGDIPVSDLALYKVLGKLDEFDESHWHLEVIGDYERMKTKKKISFYFPVPCRCMSWSVRNSSLRSPTGC
jgi:hypothetical protein